MKCIPAGMQRAQPVFTKEGTSQKKSHSNYKLCLVIFQHLKYDFLIFLCRKVATTGTLLLLISVFSHEVTHDQKKKKKKTVHNVRMGWKECFLWDSCIRCTHIVRSAHSVIYLHSISLGLMLSLMLICYCLIDRYENGCVLRRHPGV